MISNRKLKIKTKKMIKIDLFLATLKVIIDFLTIQLLTVFKYIRHKRRLTRLYYNFITIIIIAADLIY